MGFPVSIEELRVGLDTRRAAIRGIDEELKRLKEQRETNELMADVLEGLMESWKHPDPGKYKDAYFFLSSDLKKRVVVRQFLAPGTKIYQNAEEWRSYDWSRPSRHGSFYFDGVPFYYPIIDVNDAGKIECPTCGQPQLVVEHYVQTYDSPEGDVWLKRQLIVCLDCDKITIHEKAVSDSRF